MKMEDQMRRQAEALRAEGEADRREAYDDLQRGYMAAQPGIPTGLSGARSEMSRRTRHLCTWQRVARPRRMVIPMQILERQETLLALWVAQEAILA